jgi:hypothetical protein
MERRAGRHGEEHGEESEQDGAAAERHGRHHRAWAELRQGRVGGLMVRRIGRA